MSTGNARFRRLMDLVGEALDRNEADRDVWLASQCGDDADLLAEARSLLREASATSLDALTARLEAGIARAAGRLTESVTPIPGRIGPYIVVEVIGEGGMGRVYGARQEEPLPRNVAVKVIATGVHAPDLIARFEAERRVMASLEHPNIAHVFDAGTTAEGLPYFAMEWVRDSLPITEFCDARGLDVRARLRLFRKVLGAVQHAHHKAIVHRDLKPSNVLVSGAGGEPVPKVIDFGVAKVAAEASSGAPAYTMHGGRVGTLEYMSPEQALGSKEAVDTRSDIYSLGVLLYELLTGSLPFPADTLRSASPAELDHLVRHSDPPAPSRRVATGTSKDAAVARVRATDARRLARILRGDLDNIVRMALEKDPARRYASVAQLSGDIERYIDGRPVSAHPYNWSYAARRFVGRHRMAIAGVSAGLVLLVTGATLTLRLAAERNRARLEAASTANAASYLQRIFQVPDADVLGATGPTAGSPSDDSSGAAPAGRPRGPPLLPTSELGVLAITYCALGQYDQAVRALEDALAARDALGGRTDLVMASAMHDVGRAKLDLGDMAGAEKDLRGALALRMELLGRDSPATAATMSLLAVALPPDRHEAAEMLARDAVEAHRRGPEPDNLQLAFSLETLAFLLQHGGRLDESEAFYREAIALRERLAHPADPDLLRARCSLSVLLEGAGRYAEAETLLREVLDQREASLGREHPATLLARSNLAYLLWRTGQYPRAEALFREVVSLGRSAYGGDHVSLAIMLDNLGIAARRSGDLSAAEAAHGEALEMNRRLLGPEHARVASDMDNLGRVLLAGGDARAAERLHREALAMRLRLQGEGDPALAETLSGLAAARFELEAVGEAETLLRRALALRRSRFGERDPTVARSTFDLGVLLRKTGRYVEAEQLLRTTLDIRRAGLDGAHPAVAATLRELGVLLRETGRIQEAEAHLVESRRLAAARLGDEDPETRAVDEELRILRAMR